jgi:hypothetical protein
VTLAIEMSDTEEDMIVAWAAATCHPKDNFCKATGRVKAAGRLNSPLHRILPLKPMTLKETLEDLRGVFMTVVGP